MTRELTALYSFNHGIVSRLGLARLDVKRIALAAQVQTNLVPRLLGCMTVRPGMGHLGATLSNAAERMLRFVFSTDDVALVELTSGMLRFWLQDGLLTRATVNTAVTNGTFPSNLTGWTDSDDAGAASTWVSPGFMQLLGNGTARAIRDQQVTVSAGDVDIEHALRIVVVRGPVFLRVGASQGSDGYVRETVLQTGVNSIAFTPSGDFWIRFFSSRETVAWVSQCTVESSGVVTLPAPWDAEDLDSLNYDQSGDVLFVACANRQQRRIVRRGTRPDARSWSVEVYAPEDGPFMVENVSPTLLTPSAISGNMTLTASVPLFRSTHVGALFSLSSTGQVVTTTSALSGTSTDPIRVTGIDSARKFSVVIAGDASGSTVDLQRSYDNSIWADVGAPHSWTADVTTTVDDGLDNQIVYYRLRLTTRVAPDTVTMTLRIGSGSVRGVVRVTAFTSSTSVDAEVLAALGGTDATEIWQEGHWSDVNGWPTAVRFFDGRLWWSGANGVWGSISDAFDSFDETVVGDAGPINRTIGAGPVDIINWMLPLQRLVLGAQGAEISVRSNSLDEPLTASNFHLKAASTQGSAGVTAVQCDQEGYFVGRNGCRVYKLVFDVKTYDYSSVDITALCPEIGQPGIVRMDIQRQPDTRLHCVRSDGTVAVAMLDASEDALAWFVVETDGLVEDVVVLPSIEGDLDDRVYYVVRRVVDGATVRYLEKWAQEADCRGGGLCLLADAHKSFSFAGPTSTVNGLDHLEGREVVVWADAADVGTDDSSTDWTQTYTVSGGLIQLAAPATQVVVGLGYTGQWQSVKLGSLPQGGTPLNQSKAVKRIGVLLADTHVKGLRFGPDFDHLDDMPSMEGGAEVSGVWESYDDQMMTFPGRWLTDARVCIQVQAPRPCTLLGLSIEMSVSY